MFLANNISNIVGICVVFLGGASMMANSGRAGSVLGCCFEMEHGGAAAKHMKPPNLVTKHTPFHQRGAAVCSVIGLSAGSAN